MKRIYWATFLLVLIACQANAQSTLALQEKCAEGAKKFFSEFKGRYGSDPDFYLSYTCHYNKKSDRCFIHISVFIVDTDAKEDCVSQYLFDVFGGFPDSPSKAIEYGRLRKYPFTKEEKGEVMGRACKSKREFEALIKPYMEE
jgi:hypothetical protein